MKTTKYLSLHAHFYQPPRENPWLGEIEKQNSAWPYDNWNHRIAMECYIPNLFGKINNYRGETLELVNNYEYMNFNFGPTLLSWLENSYPRYYEKLVETVKKTKEESGYSNAIAQSYNHTILPLDNFRDKLTQVSWGLEDFQARFGFYPEAMWLPETAVNEDVLRLLIDKGLKYAILAPYQLKSASSIKTGENLRAISPDKNYLWVDRDEKKQKIKDRSIALFVYDGELARKTAFENITFNSSVFCETINSAYQENGKENQLVLIAADGETYGHHHKFADMTLSHSFRYELSRRGITPISLSKYLSLFPPEYEAELDPGPDSEGTAWSCSHGIRRWKGGCSCGDEGHYSTAWRLPLRSAVKWLREVMADVYYEEGKNIFKNVWKARNEYGKLLVSSSEKNLQDFLNENAVSPLTPENKTKALKLLLMQKYSMFAFTSCGWFFNDISRIETQQNLKYASMALELAQGFGFKGIERAFASLLEMAPSNFPDFSNGRKVYETLVKDAALSEKTALSFLLMRLLSGTGENHYKNQKYEISLKKRLDFILPGMEIKTGTAEVRDLQLFSFSEIHFALAARENSLPEIYFTASPAEENAFKTEQEFIDFIKNAELVKTLDLPKSFQKELAGILICGVKRGNYAFFKNILKNYLSIMENEKDAPHGTFENVIKESEFYIKQLIKIKLKEFLEMGREEAFSELKELTEIADRFSINPAIEFSPDLAALIPLFVERLYSPETDEKKAVLYHAIFLKMGADQLSFHLDNYLESLKTKEKTAHSGV